MLKQKIDQIAAHHGREGEDGLRADIIDIVKEAVGEMIGHMHFSDNERKEFFNGYSYRIREEKAKAEEILNQLK